MKRRKALQNIGLAAGAGLLLPAGLFSGCKEEDYQQQFWLQSEIDLLNEIGETILPETPDAPGARAAKVANFMDAYIADCVSAEDQQLLKNGMLSFRESVKQKTGKTYLQLDPQQRHDFLVAYDAEARKHNQQLKEGEVPHFFPMLKSLVLFAYFTSEEGMTKALRYLPIPQKYVGDYAFAKGDKAWAI